MNLRKLKSEAKEAAQWRGHAMFPFATITPKVSARAICCNCKMEVYVTTKPMPNECDTMGEAVALTCEKQ